MASGTGTTVIDFGSQGVNNTSLVVTGIASIGGSAFVEAFMMRESTSDHSADEHLMVPMRILCGDVVAGVGFTIYAASEWLLKGTFAVRYVWSD